MNLRMPFLLGILSLLNACDERKESVSTTLSGEIIHPKGEVVKISYGDQEVVDTLDAENRFVFSLSIDVPNDMIFHHGGEIAEIYMRPGDALTLSLDTDFFDETLTFDGGGAEINRYKAAMTLLGDTLIGYRELMMLSEDHFLATIDSVAIMKLGYLDDYNIVDEEYLGFIMNNSKYEVAIKKNAYPRDHKYFSKLDSFEVNQSYYDFRKDLDMNDSSQLVYPTYMDYVINVIETEAFSRMGKPGVNRYDSVYQEVVNELISEVVIKESLLYDFLKNYFYSIKPKEREAFLSVWKAMNPSKSHLVEVEEIVAKWIELDPGKVAPDFTYATLEGDSASLSDFRGKLVYIDVWATWCGPCRKEHPAMEKLQDRFKDQDVVFLAVSIDNSLEPWQKMIEQKKLGGVHLIAPNKQNPSIMKDYMIDGIPRFILVDREGNLIDVDASRPSGNIGDQLEELLKKS